MAQEEASMVGRASASQDIFGLAEAAIRTVSLLPTVLAMEMA